MTSAMGGLRSIESSFRKRVVASSWCCGSDDCGGGGGGAGGGGGGGRSGGATGGRAGGDGGGGGGGSGGEGGGGGGVAAERGGGGVEAGAVHMQGQAARACSIATSSDRFSSFALSVMSGSVPTLDEAWPLELLASRDGARRFCRLSSFFSLRICTLVASRRRRLSSWSIPFLNCCFRSSCFRIPAAHRRAGGFRALLVYRQN